MQYYNFGRKFNSQVFLFWLENAILQLFVKIDFIAGGIIWFYTFGKNT